MLLTQLQQDTQGNIMDIFLLLPSCGWCVSHVLSYFYSSFSFFFNFSGCNFKFYYGDITSCNQQFEYHWVHSGIVPMLAENIT